MKASDLVVTDLDGKIVEGKLRPSSDLATHLALYRAFPEIGGVVHTHSRAATVWAQAGREIPCLGTTHADYFHGSIPVAGPLTDEEVRGDYELNTGLAIVRRFRGSIRCRCRRFWSLDMRPFTWGKDAAGARVQCRGAGRGRGIGVANLHTASRRPANRAGSARQTFSEETGPECILRPEITNWRTQDQMKTDRRQMIGTMAALAPGRVLDQTL